MSANLTENEFDQDQERRATLAECSIMNMLNGAELHPTYKLTSLSAVLGIALTEGLYPGEGVDEADFLEQLSYLTDFIRMRAAQYHENPNLAVGVNAGIREHGERVYPTKSFLERNELTLTSPTRPN